jgi:hypothetical protein
MVLGKLGQNAKQNLLEFIKFQDVKEFHLQIWRNEKMRKVQEGVIWVQRRDAPQQEKSVQGRFKRKAHPPRMQTDSG